MAINENDVTMAALHDVPLSSLRDSVSDTIKTLSDAYNTGHWQALTSVLQCVSTLVGANYMVKAGPYLLPTHQWLLTVGREDSARSQMMRALYEPVDELQATFDSRAKEDEEKYKKDISAWKKELYTLLDQGESHEEATKKLPKRPVSPAAQQLYFEHSPNESLFEILANNPGGVVWKADTIDSWVKNKTYTHKSLYINSQSLQSMYDGSNLRIVKKKGCVLNVPCAWLSIYGNIQPETLPAFHPGWNASFLRNFLFVFSDEVPPVKFSQTETCDAAIAKIFSGMLHWERLTPKPIIEAQETEAPVITFEENAFTTYSDYVFSMQNDGYYSQDKSVRKLGLYSNIPEQCARFIFNIHCLECSLDGEKEPRKQISVETTRSALSVFDSLYIHNKYAWSEIARVWEEKKGRK